VKERAFISSESCTGVPLDNASYRFWKQKGAAHICTCLGMMNGMCSSAPDVMEHGASLKEIPVDKGVISREFKRAIRDSPAVRDHLVAATGIPQQYLVLFTRTGHDRVIPEYF
jgi:hypothetical protein